MKTKRPSPAQWRRAAELLASGEHCYICCAVEAVVRDSDPHVEARDTLIEIGLLHPLDSHMLPLHPRRRYPSHYGSLEERQNVRVLACLFLEHYERDLRRRKAS